MFPAIAQHRALSGFEILEPLGSGGAGQVFLAKSKGGRRVAIKVLSDARERDEAFARALAREASLCVRLTHPAIVQVRAFVEDEGFAAIVFDYVEGIALARLLRFCSAVGARLPDRVAWHVVERVLSALAFAHAQKDEQGEPAPIVHRDVSPSNVLISFGGDVKLTDFGIAKMLGVSPATQFGLVKGTLGCMAPEQARGEAVDERADVYAAGLLAWRLGTGRAPFKASLTEVELLRAMRHPRIKPLAALRPDLPERITRAVELALAAERGERTLRAEEFAAEVRASMDTDRGHTELRDLLHRWRGALARHSPALSSTDSSSNHKQPTMNYEQVAAMDDEPAHDGPTLETHALPGDDALWKALAMQGTLGLPPAASPASEGPMRSAEAVRVAKETPMLPLAPLRDVEIAPVDEPAPAVVKPHPSPAVAERPKERSSERTRETFTTERSARSKPRRRLVPLLILALVGALAGAVLAWFLHERRHEARPSPTSASTE
jgi:serine/threonine protein kinase